MTTTTYADVVKASEVPAHSNIDDATPEGHFTVLTKILGILTVYLLKGDLDAPDAVVVGRIEIPDPTHTGPLRPSIAYKGNGLKGGEYSGTVEYFDESFDKLI